MPIDEGLGGAAQFFAGVADVIEDGGIVLLEKFRRMKELFERLFGKAFFEMHPAEAVEIRAVVRLHIHGLADQ